MRIFPHTVVTLVANEVGYVTSIEHTELTTDHHDAVPQGPDEVGIGVRPGSNAEKFKKGKRSGRREGRLYHA